MVKINFESYAIALFSVAKDKQEQKLFYSLAKQLADVNNECSDFATLLSSRSISKIERKEIAYDILNEFNFDKTFIYWVWTLIDGNVYSFYDEIMHQVAEQYYYLFNIEHVSIWSAHDLNQTQITRLKQFFEDKLHKEIILTIKVDPSYIGGLKIKIRNKLYDNTFTDQLKKLKFKILSKE